jgi:predicted methyltransferase MtxX (methanogen marker protein 4)
MKEIGYLFDFVELGAISGCEVGKVVDVVGVVQWCGPLTEFECKNTHKMLQKRDIHLVDTTVKTVVRLTLWGVEAENFEEHMNAHPVVVLKGARVGDFGRNRRRAVNDDLYFLLH